MCVTVYVGVRPTGCCTTQYENGLLDYRAGVNIQYNKHYLFEFYSNHFRFFDSVNLSNSNISNTVRQKLSDFIAINSKVTFLKILELFSLRNFYLNALI